MHAGGELGRIDFRADDVVRPGGEGADHVLRVRHHDGARDAAEPRERRERDDREVGGSAVDDLEAGGSEPRGDAAGERRVDDDAGGHSFHVGARSYETAGIGTGLSESTAASQIFAPPILARWAA